MRRVFVGSYALLIGVPMPRGGSLTLYLHCKSYGGNMAAELRVF